VSGVVSPPHRPAVAFSAHRASAPARRPAVACDVRRPRSISATSGRLDGLPRRRCTLLRCVLPEGAPLENVPKHARSVGGTFSRTARPPLRPPRSPNRACGSRAPLKELRSAFARRAAGGCPAPVPRVPDARRRRCACRCAMSRAPWCTRRGEPATWGVRGPRDAEPVISPIAFRSPACRSFFSDDWLRHAPSREPLQRRLASATRLPENFVRQQRPWGRRPRGFGEGPKQLRPARFQIQLRNC
jgi:hypothetical protein